MELTLTIADPAGNVTLLVESPVSGTDYFSVANRLLQRTELGGEQVGYLTRSRMGGDIRLEMMGGEFCGNAARCAGLYHVRKQGCFGRALVEVSGCTEPVPVEVTEEGVWAEMPLPVSLEQISLDGEVFDAVRFEGIVHLIVPGKPRDAAWTAAQLPVAAAHFGLSAAGMMFLTEEGMTPAVYVRDTDTLFWENSCASGSAAAAWWAAQRLEDGLHRRSLNQPGGCIETIAKKCGGEVVSVRLGGPVSIGASTELEL